MKRQWGGEARVVAQDRIRRIHDELRARQEVRGRRAVGVVAHVVFQRKLLRAVGDEIFQRLVDHVYVWQGRVRVLACQRQVLNVRAPVEEDGLRVLLANLFRRLVNEEQQVYQVGRGRKDGAAVIAGAEVHLAEESFERRVGDDVGGVIGRRAFRLRLDYLPGAVKTLLSRFHRLRAESDAVFRGQVTDGEIEDCVMDLQGLVVNKRGGLRPAQVRLIGLDERLFIVAHDLVCGIDPAFHQGGHRLIAWRYLVYPLQSRHLLHRRVGDLQIVPGDELPDRLNPDLEFALLFSQEGMHLV